MKAKEPQQSHKIMKRIEFPVYSAINGDLTVFEAGKTIPFEIRRVFSVVANRNARRGAHAHHRCSQLFVCVSGRIRVTCSDGKVTERIDLETSQAGVLVTPGIWATQEYLEDRSTMIVFCDREYEPEDYIRDYEEFLRLKVTNN